MVNITIYTDRSVDIEDINYQINNREDMIKFLSAVFDKVFYSGERICLETGDIKDNNINFTTIDRWG